MIRPAPITSFIDTAEQDVPGQSRKTAGLVVGGVALIELAAAASMRASGSELQPGPIPFHPSSASTTFLVSVVLGSAAVWLLEPCYSAVARWRIGRACRCLAYAFVVVGFVPLAIPIVQPGFLIGHDAAAHQTYAFLFDRALSQGQLPVRWVEGIADGLGQPLFNHYQVGFYYLVAILHRCGPGLELAIKLTVVAQWALGALFTFLLCRPLGPLPGALAAAVFLWSPYLLVDAYVRSAYPELTAIGFASGVLWSIHRVLRTRRRIYVCLLALTIGLLLISHLPTAAIVAPAAAAFVLGWWIVHRHDAGAIGFVALGALIGAGLAAFYALPAIVEIDAVNISRLTTGGFDYRLHFVRPAWWFDRSWGYGGSGAGADDRLSLQIGVVQWAVLTAAIALLVIPRFRRLAAVPTIAILGWLTLAGGALLMMTPASTPVWQSIGSLAFVQFPWRFLMVPTLACAPLAAIVLSTIRNRTTQALVVACAVTIQWNLTEPYREIASTRERGAISIDDPAWVSTENGQSWAFREAAYDPLSVQDEARPASGRWTVTEGRGEVSATSLTDTRLRLAVRAEDSVKLVINSPFVTGWQVTLDGRPFSPTIQFPSGYMEVQVPAGVHSVDAVFGRSRVRAAAEAITLISAIAWVALACWRPRFNTGRSLPAEALAKAGSTR